MDPIEPVSPSPPMIAPIDATRVKLLGREREAALAQLRERERRRRREEAEAEAQAQEPSEQDGDDGENGRPHVDLRV
ncbi:MAG TPA: hypothetical protein VGF95_03115 [Solirubrobacteraceae bacterium]